MENKLQSLAIQYFNKTRLFPVICCLGILLGMTGFLQEINAQCPIAPPIVGTITQPTCANATGSVFLNGLPGPLTWTINPGAITGSTPNITITGLAAGATYNFTVSTNFPCTSLPSADIVIGTPPAAPAAPTASVTTQPTCAIPTGNIVVSAPLGAGFEYSIGGAYQASPAFTAVAPGVQNITVRLIADPTCVSPATVVTIIAAIAAEAPATTVTAQPTCAVSTGTILITAPLGAYEYNIDGGAYQSSLTFAGIAAGSHDFLARRTTDNTCISSATTVAISAQPSVPAAPAANVTAEPTCTLATGTIVVTAPTGAYEYNIDGGAYQASVTFAGIAAGIHNLLARRTTDNTCISNPTPVNIASQPSAPAAPSAGVTAQPSCSIATGTITVTAPVGAYEYNIDGGAFQPSLTFSGIAAGAHNILARRTADITCISTATSLTINAQPSAPSAPTAVVTAQPSCAVSTGTIVVTAPTGAFEYTIDGGTYQSSVIFAGIAAGSHTVIARRVTDNTCISPPTAVTITAQPTVPPAPTAGITAQPGCAVATGTIVVSAPLGAYEYNIDGGPFQTSVTFAGIASGAHNILVRRSSDNTCISAASALTVNTPPAVPSAPAVNITAQPSCSVSTGTIVITAPVGAYEYNIDGGTYQSSVTFAGTAAGSHNILVRRTTDNTCISNATAVTIDAQPAVPPAPAVSITAQPTCAVSTGTIAITSPSGAFEYSIDGGIYQASATFTGISSGLHNIFVRRTTDITCISTATTINISAQPAPPSAPTASVTAQPTCSSATGTIVITAPAGAFEYTIDAGAFQTSVTFAGVTAGAHTMIARRTTDNTCISTATVISVNTAPSVPAAPTASVTAQPTCAVSTATIVITAPLGALEYNMDGGVYQSSATFSGIAAGSHFLSVRRTSDNTCVSNTTQVIVNAQPVTPSAPITGTITQPTCTSATGTVALSGLAAQASIPWTLTRIPDGFITSGTGPTTIITGLTQGTYAYTITNASGCTSQASVNIIINAQPPTPVVANQTISVLTGTTFSVTPNGVPAGTTYVWAAPTYSGGVTGGKAQPIPQPGISGTLIIPTGNGSATYTVIPAAGACFGASFTVTVTVTSLCIPVFIGTQPRDTSMCTGIGNASFTAGAVGTSPFTYRWQYNTGGTWSNIVDGAPAGALYTGQLTETLGVTGITASGITNYRCFVSNCSGAINALSNAASLTVNATPSAPVTGTVSQPDCFVGTGGVTLSGLPAGNWVLNPGAIAGTGPGATLSGLISGTHAFTVTSAAGCSSIATGNIDIKASPETPSAPVIGTIRQPTCVVATGSVEISGLPPGNWTINPGAINGNTQSITISVSIAGTYAYTVTNAAGCISSASTVVIINAQPATPSAPTAGANIQPDCLVLTGTIGITAPVGAGMTYSIDGLTYTNASGIFKLLTAGTYKVTARSSAGCISASTSVIMNPRPDCFPVASNDVSTIPGGIALSATVAANDTPSSDGGNVWSLVGTNGGAAKGSVTMNAAGAFTYILNASFQGMDTFSYQLCDADGDCAEATVIITRNQAPFAGDDADTTLADEPLSVNILGNDSDPENSALTTTLCTSALHGDVVITADGTFTYTPFPGFSGNDSICYTICDSGIPVMCDEAIVYINVKPIISVDNILVYNALTPNGDGSNDGWKIGGIEAFPDNEVRIFNRWGDKVFAAVHYDNLNVYWNGTFKNNQLLPDGTYYYIIDIKGIKSYTGWIYLKDSK